MSNTDIEPIRQQLPQLNHMRNNRLEDSLFSKDLAPHYMQLAGKLAASELVPKCFRGKPQDLFLCWAMGYQVGLTPEQSMQCIAVINGKPAMWGDDMLALCMSHKDFDDIIETPMVKNDAIFGYTCTVKRKGKADKENVFTMDMAKRAGLLAKGGVWAQYPERMLKLRARGLTLRDAFPDALKGIKPREEVEDYIDAEYTITKASNTERLKLDIMTKQGASDVDGVDRAVQTMADKDPDEEVEETIQPLCETQDPQEATKMHIEIERLINEKSFTQERLDKALNYYEVTSIASLDNESARHFIETLLKL